MEEIKGGLIVDPRPQEEKIKDYVLGATNLNWTKRNVQWKPYFSELQYQVINGVDTMSCVSFSVARDVEAQLNHDYTENKLSEKTKDFLNNNGYIKNGKVCISSCHLAIASETKPDGNYFQKVWDTVRNVGVVPEDTLLWTGNTWNELHKPSKVTQSIKTLASAFKEVFLTEYAWVESDYTRGINAVERKDILEKLQYAPIEIGTPIPAVHSTLLYDLEDTTYDQAESYPPFHREIGIDFKPIHFAMIGYIQEKTVPEKTYPKYIFARNLTKGMRGADVKILQDILKIEGCLDIAETTNFYGAMTFRAVKKFQEKYKSQILTPIGYTKGTGLFWDRTRAFMNNLIK